MSVVEVIAGERRWWVEQGDCLAWMDTLPEDSVDLVFGSPPYRLARTYGIDFSLKDQEWVDWMVAVFHKALRICKGLVAFVLEGQTKNYRWTAEPALLMADLHRAGVNLRRPCFYKRVGIPGSGGPDWLRGDTEFIVCATRPGRLPWSDNTACGHPPKYAPGGEMSHRVPNGQRVNQWGMNVREDGSPTATSRGGDGVTEINERRPRARKPSHKVITRPPPGQSSQESTSYDPPAVANPGNVIECKVGGGQMGHPLCHENEAPFPEELAAFFVRSFCPPEGLTVDCFSGSGTTGAVCLQHGRRFLGCDLRESQVELSRKRIATVTPTMFPGG